MSSLPPTLLNRLTTTKYITEQIEFYVKLLYFFFNFNIIRTHIVKQWHDSNTKKIQYENTISAMIYIYNVLKSLLFSSELLIYLL